MAEAQLLSSSYGHPFVVITAGQQIYKVMIDNILATPGVQQCVLTIWRIIHNQALQWQGMLVTDSCQSEIIKLVFGGVDKN